MNMKCMEYVARTLPFTVRRTVKWGDCDPAGVVYTYEAGPEGCEVLEIRFGVERYATDFPDQPESYWSGLLASVERNGPTWRSKPSAPA